ncbi:TIGR04283 family arsenosugar biosynthesis glycosyltransferase [Flavobacteriaceae bacterium]|nr:TIGR04283 family arsenosugar biosynthesis glycosyltransferase [Flavobacteriaceae bacterium]
MNQSNTLELCVVVPTLNEANNILRTLDALFQRAVYPKCIEVIIVDGGSTDQTQNVVQQWQKKNTPYNVTLLQGPAGRARQMNLGASHARAKLLYFIHADTLPPQNYDELILNQKDQDCQAGCFRMDFDSAHWWLKMAGWGTRFHWKFCRGGDQSLFVCKALFERIGGYSEDYIICEDLNLIDRLYAETRFCVLPQKVISSARKYKSRGLWQLQWHFWVIQYNYRRGHSPEQLWAYYQRNVWPNTQKNE